MDERVEVGKKICRVNIGSFNSNRPGGSSRVEERVTVYDIEKVTPKTVVLVETDRFSTWYTRWGRQNIERSDGEMITLKLSKMGSIDTKFNIHLEHLSFFVWCFPDEVEEMKRRLKEVVSGHIRRYTELAREAQKSMAKLNSERKWFRCKKTNVCDQGEVTFTEGKVYEFFVQTCSDGTTWFTSCCDEQGHENTMYDSGLQEMIDEFAESFEAADAPQW